MKTTVLFRAVVLAVMSVMCVANVELKAQEPSFVTNEVVTDNLVTAKIIYRLDGTLYRHMKYDYAYDNQSRVIAKEAFKWDAITESWTPYFKIACHYSSNEVTIEYARWNTNCEAYNVAPEKSVYKLDAENLPVAYVNYKWNQSEKGWSMEELNNFDSRIELMAIID